jgi:hypothetical protein
MRYIGTIYKNCSPTDAQQSALKASTDFVSTMKDAYGQVFGAGSKIFNSLKAGWDKIINTTHGMTPDEIAARRSEISTNAAAANIKVQQAIGRRAAVTSAVPGVESGVAQAERAQAAADIATKESAAQEAVTGEDYNIGRQMKVRGMEAEAKLPGEAFTPAAEFASGTENAIKTESDQANANAQASSSWMGMVGGLASAGIGLAGDLCVALDTLIRMGDETEKPANELKIGDMVFGFEGPEAIKNLIISTQPRVRITLDNDYQIVVSSSHTFYSPMGGYIEASASLDRYLRTDDAWNKVVKVEVLEPSEVIMIKLTGLHGYMSNGIWSLE